LSWTSGRGCDPGGIRTRDLDLERVASLARLDDGVRMDARTPTMIAEAAGPDNRRGRRNQTVAARTRPPPSRKRPRDSAPPSSGRRPRYFAAGTRTHQPPHVG